MKIAISLIWVRHHVAGGVESFTRNLLDGFVENKAENQYILICSKDNYNAFKHYIADSRFSIYECPLKTVNVKQTIFFESFRLDRLVSRLGADICFVPCYRMPMLFKRNKYVVVIHDLISCHYPQNFPYYRAKWLTWASKRACMSADKVVAISQFVKDDILSRFCCPDDRIDVIYNPILPNFIAEDFSKIEDCYNIKRGEYLYTVCSLAPNKNLVTLLALMKRLKTSEQFKHYKLLISGVGLNNPIFAESQNVLFDYMEKNGIKESCLFTGFVSNERRNSLIRHSAFFLFPSIFEGFGMPVIEALELGAKVVTTKCASLLEVSQNQAIYVSDPFDDKEWELLLERNANDTPEIHHFPEYEVNYVVSKYLDLFHFIS